MTATEFRQHRKTLGMTQEAICKPLGLSVRAIKRYEAGAVPVPFLVAITVLRMVANEA